jgi:hypothetical protein
MLIITVISQGVKYRNWFLFKDQNIDNIDLKVRTKMKQDTILHSSGSRSMVEQKYMKKLCDLDKISINKLKEFNVGMNMVIQNQDPKENVNDFFHKFVQNPHLSFCTEMKRFGGKYNSNCKFTDGSKFVCIDDLLKDIENGECLIYSLGVADDWSFEDVMDDLGCKIYAFDGSVDYPTKRGNGIHFEKIWVSREDNEPENIISLPTLMAKYGHTEAKISYFKMDIEGNELKGLPVWLKSGALDNVKQIALEFHLDRNIMTTINFINSLKELYFDRNYRLISYEANGCAKNSETNGGRNRYFNLAEIVLKKIDNAEKCV